MLDNENKDVSDAEKKPEKQRNNKSKTTRAIIRSKLSLVPQTPSLDYALGTFLPKQDLKNSQHAKQAPAALLKPAASDAPDALARSSFP